MRKFKKIIAILMSLNLASTIIPSYVNAWDYPVVCLDTNEMVQNLKKIKQILVYIKNNVSPRLNTFMGGLLLIIDEMLSLNRDGYCPEFQDLLLKAYNYLNNLHDYLMGDEIDDLKVLGRKNITSVASFIRICLNAKELAALEFFKKPESFNYTAGMRPSHGKALKFKYANNFIVFKLLTLANQVLGQVVPARLVHIQEFSPAYPAYHEISRAFSIGRVKLLVGPLVTILKNPREESLFKDADLCLSMITYQTDPSKILYLLKVVYYKLCEIYKIVQPGSAKNLTGYTGSEFTGPEEEFFSKNILLLSDKIKSLVKSITYAVTY